MFYRLERVADFHFTALIFWLLSFSSVVVATECTGSSNGDGASQPVLQFHNTRGEYVRISADRSVARRFDSFCKGIAFSQRAVRPNEKVTDHLPRNESPSSIRY